MNSQCTELQFLKKKIKFLIFSKFIFFSKNILFYSYEPELEVH